MKSAFFILSTALLLVNQSFGSNLQAFFDYNVFNTPENKPYVETYLNVLGNSIVYKQLSNNKFRGTVEISMKIKVGKEIKYEDRYYLYSPEIDSLTANKVSFVDMQRFNLADGHYAMEFQIRDFNADSVFYTISEDVHIHFPKDSINISDIQAIESFAKTETVDGKFIKNGMKLIPYVNDVYPSTKKKIIFYTEIYNTTQIFMQDGKYLVNCFIKDASTGKQINHLFKSLRKTASEVGVLMLDFPIDDLITGNYNLVIEVRNKDNQLVKRKTKLFYRRNLVKSAPVDLNSLSELNTSFSFVEGYVNADSLSEHINCLSPISSEREASFGENQINAGQLEMMKKYFLNFWLSRNSENPQLEWDKYRREVKAVNKVFSTRLLKGYKTDRGRVYLQYGPPNTIAKADREPNAYPYEIWHYYEVAGQSNRKFVYYNRALSTNKFELLHSDVKGESFNNQWKFSIYRRTMVTETVDFQENPTHFGGNLEQYYNDPR